MINLAEKYVMMIEPDKEGVKSEIPLDDNITIAMESLMEMCNDTPLGMRYRGFHSTLCNETSDNKDWVLPSGQITNSLASYYLRYYRPYVPECEIEKIKVLAIEHLKIKL